jgi:serine/threonine-protein kinase HipA
LHLNVNDIDNQLDFNLAFGVINYFQLSDEEAKTILAEVLNAVKTWADVARELGISNSEFSMMEPAFQLIM